MRHKPIVNRTKKDPVVKPEIWQIAEFARKRDPIAEQSAKSILNSIAEEEDPWSFVSDRDWSKTKLVTLNDADARQYAFEFGSLVRGYLIRGDYRSAASAFIDAGFIKYFEVLFYHLHEASYKEKYPLFSNREIIEFWMRAKRVVKALHEIAARAMLKRDAFVALTRNFMEKESRPFEGKNISNYILELYNDLATFACWAVMTEGKEKNILKYVSKEKRRELSNKADLFNEWLAVLAVGCCKFLAFCDTVLKPALAKLIEAEGKPLKKKPNAETPSQAAYASNIYTDNGFSNNAFSALKGIKCAN